MQWNQSYPTAACECDPFKARKNLPHSRVIGEGDVTSVIFPDGSIQSYFVPINSIRYGRWLPCEHNVTNSRDTQYYEPNTEYWFVRSISYPYFTPTTVNNNQLPKYGDHLASNILNPFYYIQPYKEYYQKFHNDSSTSTTDIYYFYPCLRPDKAVKFGVGVAVQTDNPFNSYYDGMFDRSPHSIVKEKNCKCACQHGSESSASCMSVDGNSKLNLANKKTCNCSKRRKQYKNKAKNNKVHCKCKKITSNKCVTTYTDQASGTATIDECVSTQNMRRKSKRNDVKMEIWTPLHNDNSSQSCMSTLCSQCRNSRSSCACTSDNWEIKSPLYP